MSFEAVPCMLRNQEGQPMYGLLIRPSQQTIIVQTPSSSNPPVSGNKLLLPPQNSTFVQAGTSQSQPLATLLTQSSQASGVLRSPIPVSVQSTKPLNQQVFIPTSTVQAINSNSICTGSEQVVPQSPGSPYSVQSNSNFNTNSNSNLNNLTVASVPVQSQSQQSQGHSFLQSSPQSFEISGSTEFSAEDAAIFSPQNQNIRTVNSQQSNNVNNGNANNNNSNELNSIFECLGARDLADLLSQSEAILSPDCAILDDATVDANTSSSNSHANSHVTTVQNAFQIHPQSHHLQLHQNQLQQPTHQIQQHQPIMSHPIQNYSAMDFTGCNQSQQSSENFDSMMQSQPGNNMVRAPCRYQNQGQWETHPPQVLHTPSSGVQYYQQLNDHHGIIDNQKDSNIGRSVSRTSSLMQANPPSVSSYEPISDTEPVKTAPQTQRKRHSSSSSSDQSPQSQRMLKKRKRKFARGRARSNRCGDSGGGRKFDDMPMLEAESPLSKRMAVGESPGAATSTDSDGGASLATLAVSSPPPTPKVDVSQLLSVVGAKFDKTCMKVMLKEPEEKIYDPQILDPSTSAISIKNSVSESPESAKTGAKITFGSNDPNAMVEQLLSTLPPDQLEQFTKAFALKMCGSKELPPTPESSKVEEKFEENYNRDEVQDQAPGYLSDASSITSTEFSASSKLSFKTPQASASSSPISAELRKRQMMFKLQAYRNKTRILMNQELIESVLIQAGRLASLKMNDFASPNSPGSMKPSCLQVDVNALERRLEEQKENERKKQEELILAENRAKVVENERVIAEARAKFLEEERILAETRAKFEEEERIIAETRAKVVEEQRVLAETKAKLLQEEENNRVIELKKKLDATKNIEAPSRLELEDLTDNDSGPEEEAPILDAIVDLDIVKTDDSLPEDKPEFVDNLQNIEAEAEEDDEINAEADIPGPDSQTRTFSPPCVSPCTSPLVQIREKEGRSISLKINLSKFNRSKREAESKLHEVKSSCTETLTSTVSSMKESVLPPKKRIRNQQFCLESPPPLIAADQNRALITPEPDIGLSPPVLEAFTPQNLTPSPPKESLKLTIKTNSFKTTPNVIEKRRKKKKRHSSYPWDKKIRKLDKNKGNNYKTKISDKLVQGIDSLRKKISDTVQKKTTPVSVKSTLKSTTTSLPERRVPRKSSLKNGPIKECPECQNMARFAPGASKVCLECSNITESPAKLPSPKKYSPKSIPSHCEPTRKCSSLPKFDPNSIPDSYLNSGGFKLPYDIWYHFTPSIILDPCTNYRKIRTNLYVEKPRGRASQPSVCSCKLPTIANELACGEDCLNRKLYIECDPNWCESRFACSNQRFQKMHWASGLTKFDTQSARGSGVKTTRPLGAGTFLCEYVGEVVSASEFADRMSNRYTASSHHYALNLDSGYVIDSYKCGSIARFVNHSCKPNCEMQKWSVGGISRMGIFTLTDMKVNEELTYDYRFLSFSDNQICLCGQENCRGAIAVRKGGDKQRARKKELGRVSKNCSFLVSKQIALNQRTILRPLSHRERVFVEKKKIFMLRNVDKVRKIKKEKEVIPRNNSRNQLKITVDSKVVKKVTLNRILYDIFIFVLTSKDSYGSHFLPRLNPPKSVSRDNSNTPTKLPTEFENFGAYISSGVYENLENFDRDIRKFIDQDAKSSRIVCKDLTILEGLQEAYMNAKLQYLSELKTDLALKIPPDFVPEKAPEVEQTIVIKEEPIVKDELLNTTTDLSYLDPSCAVPAGSYDPEECEGLWSLCDSGVDKVRCSCGYHDENGLMLQCDACFYWQHADCLHPQSTEADPFYCDICKETSASKAISKFPVRDVLLVPEPNKRLKSCIYYRALVNNTNMQIRLSECVYVLKLINDDHKLALKRLYEECVEEAGNELSQNINKPQQARTLIDKGMDTNHHYKREQLRVFRVERLFRDAHGQSFVFGFYYARPHETFCEPTRRFYANELLCTPLYDTLPLDAVVAKCLVMDANNYCRGRPKWPKYRDEDIFVCELRVDKAQRMFEKLREKNRSTLPIPNYLFNAFKHKIKIKRDFTPFKIRNESSSTSQKRKSTEEIQTKSEPKSLSKIVDNVTNSKIVRLSQMVANLADRRSQIKEME